MKYLDEVGHLGLAEERTSADLGLAKVYSENGATLRFEGQDHQGKPWRLWIPQTGGLGWTEVWTADFDRDGQQDLLIGSHFPVNGRCQDADVFTVLFDGNGRPMPWQVGTVMPDGRDFPYMPALLLDTNGDGKAEFVATNCGHTDPLRAEAWSITGVYEAWNGRWIPLRSTSVTPYLSAAKEASEIDDWKISKPRDWKDSLIGIDAPANRRLEKLIPSDRLGYDRALYSDGRSRRGWPSVVIDSPSGRDIFIANNKAALERVARERLPLKLLGNDQEPSWIWAETK